MPKITVVVPVYNVERYLSRCVDSILSQTYENFDLILVDDGSPDKCGLMCDNYAASDSRIHVIHRNNGGLSAARNSGIEWALSHNKTKWITFIDSDDWIHKRYLEWLVKTAEKEKTNVVIGTFVRTDGTGFLEEPELVSDSFPTEEYWLKNQTNATVAWGKLYKLEDFKSLRYPEGKLHEDEFTTYKILFQYKQIAVVHTPIYFYYYNSEGITKSEWSPRRLDGLEAVGNQIEFFKTNHFDGAYHWAVWCYLDAICEHLRSIKGDSRYQEYEKELRKKLKVGIKQYKKELNLSYKTSFRFYKYAYPIRSKAYRKLRMN